MTWRAIQDTVAASESLARVTDFAERLYWRMLAQSDPWGRLPGSVTKLRALCVPLLQVTDSDVEAALAELVDVGRARLYEVDHARYCELIEFDENQPADVLGRQGKRYASRYPDPPHTRRQPARRGVSPAESESESELKTANAVSSANSPTADTDDVRTVYEVWRTERGRTNSRYAKISEARRAKIRTRLREFSVDELVRAVRGVALDPWAERPHHDDITVIFRSREQVERFLSFADERAAVANGHGQSGTVRHLEKLRAEGKL